jgi:hypothetical protein
MEEALCLGDLESKRVSRGTLVLPGEGSHTQALLGSCRIGQRRHGVARKRARARTVSGDIGEREEGGEGRRRRLAGHGRCWWRLELEERGEDGNPS